jgi:hypothetical protein
VRNENHKGTTRRLTEMQECIRRQPLGYIRRLQTTELAARGLSQGGGGPGGAAGFAHREMSLTARPRLSKTLYSLSYNDASRWLLGSRHAPSMACAGRGQAERATCGSFPVKGLSHLPLDRIEPYRCGRVPNKVAMGGEEHLGRRHPSSARHPVPGQWDAVPP